MYNSSMWSSWVVGLNTLYNSPISNHLPRTNNNKILSLKSVIPYLIITLLPYALQRIVAISTESALLSLYSRLKITPAASLPTLVAAVTSADSLLCRHILLLFQHRKNRWMLSSLAASQKTQLCGQFTPLVRNFTRVGRQFRQTRHRKFLTFGSVWRFQIKSHEPGLERWEVSISSWVQSLYALLTEKCPSRSTRQTCLSVVTEENRGVLRILLALLMSNK
jgi:hypothetical protein